MHKNHERFRRLAFWTEQDAFQVNHTLVSGESVRFCETRILRVLKMNPFSQYWKGCMHYSTLRGNLAFYSPLGAVHTKKAYGMIRTEPMLRPCSASVCA